MSEKSAIAPEVQDIVSQDRDSLDILKGFHRRCLGSKDFKGLQPFPFPIGKAAPEHEERVHTSVFSLSNNTEAHCCFVPPVALREFYHTARLVKQG